MKAPRLQSGLANTFASAGAANGSLEATRPFSIRLTEAERSALQAAAGKKPIGTFVRERLLDDAAPRRSSRRPYTSTAVLGQILARLGKSGLPSSLASFGAAARLGTVVITPEMEAQLQAVCADIQDVKRMLIRGLGLTEERRR